jgi:hypothetical protein
MTYNEIVSRATRLPLKERLMLLETLSRSVRGEMKPSMMRPRSVAGKDLMEFVSVISPEDAQVMREAIEQECERVDGREW